MKGFVIALLLFSILVIILVNAYLKKQDKLQLSKPHIVVILGDDIGWNDFGFHGSSQIPTPNIDALGYNGVFLNKFYTQAICTPSRAALLTGKYPIRFGYQGSPIPAGEDRSLPEDLKLLPEKLKQLGYKTHLVGKWHLGAARKSATPIAKGFDSHFGYWNGFVGYYDYFAYQPVVLENNVTTTWSGLDMSDNFKPQWSLQGKYITEALTERSLEIIEGHNASDPLFLYLGHLAAHTGANGTELGVPDIDETNKKYSYIEEPMRRRFAEVLNLLDKSVGEVVKKLEEKGMLDNSIILFLSDNGAQTKGLYENFGSNYPLKGLKFTLLEGGVRGSAVIFSPLFKKRGYVNNHLMHITDLFPTLLHAAGDQTVRADRLDGINQWKSISEDAPSDRGEILLNVDEVNGYSGLISSFGRYKLLNGSYENGIYDKAQGDPGRSISTPTYDIDAILLSDVNKAIRNLADHRVLTPDVILNLRRQLDINFCNGKVRKTDPPCLGECLFDLWNDPCETENLIEQKPALAELLRARLGQFVRKTVPQLNKGVDLDSNPANCNNTWFNWLDSDGCYSNKAFQTDSRTQTKY